MFATVLGGIVTETIPMVDEVLEVTKYRLLPKQLHN
jgi:hypothetical protein